MRMHPVDDWIYGADRGLSPADFEKYDVSTDPATIVGDSPYHGDYPIGGNIWISEAGDQLVVAGAATFASNPDGLLDMIYQGSLPDDVEIQWADHTTEFGEWAVLLTDDSTELPNELAYYDEQTLARVSSGPLSDIPTLMGPVTTVGSHVFFNADGSKVIVVLEGTLTMDNYAVEVRDLGR